MLNYEEIKERLATQTPRTYKQIFANSWIYNTSSSYNVGTINGSIFTLLSDIDKSSLKKGDTVDIVNGSNVVGAGATIVSVSEPTKEVTPEDTRRKALDAEKEAATKAGQPWVAVLDTQVNPENIRNGFFELDWNNEFIEQLLDAGYSGESNEEIVDQWFRTIVSQMLEDEGQSTEREMGHVKVVPIDDGKSSIG